LHDRLRAMQCESDVRLRAKHEQAQDIQEEADSAWDAADLWKNQYRQFVHEWKMLGFGRVCEMVKDNDSRNFWWFLDG